MTHNPDSQRSRRNRDLYEQQKREIDTETARSKERQLSHLDNDLDRAFTQAPKRHIATKRFAGIGPSKMFHGKQV